MLDKLLNGYVHIVAAKLHRLSITASLYVDIHHLWKWLLPLSSCISWPILRTLLTDLASILL